MVNHTRAYFIRRRCTRNAGYAQPKIITAKIIKCLIIDDIITFPFCVVGYNFVVVVVVGMVLKMLLLAPQHAYTVYWDKHFPSFIIYMHVDIDCVLLAVISGWVLFCLRRQESFCFVRDWYGRAEPDG